MSEWFESWFDSPYYPILYRHRSYQEADSFINNLFAYLNIQPQQTILDLACGAGRHAISMGKRGNTVVGIDLSSHSIEIAKETARKEQLSNVFFYIKDMRAFRLNRKFDFVFNLFTSFGYFDTKEDNFSVVESVSAHQDIGSIFVLDYFNSHLVRAKGEERYQKTIDNIQFDIHKYFRDEFVVKDILISDGDKQLKFQERVQLFTPNEISQILNRNGYNILSHFGEYDLSSYSNTSQRSIFIAKKEL